MIDGGPVRLGCEVPAGCHEPHRHGSALRQRFGVLGVQGCADKDLGWAASGAFFQDGKLRAFPFRHGHPNVLGITVDVCTAATGETAGRGRDGTFKSDRIVLGNRCNLGVTTFVHYGMTMHDGSTLGADGFLMKGQDEPADTSFVGNPAREVVPPRTSGC